jgi:hypothetical protein
MNEMTKDEGMMKGRKAQMQMMETIMVLFIFFIIIVIGLIFYSKMQESSMKQLQATRSEEDAVDIAQNMLYMPELQCSEKSVLIDVCFDVYKLDAFTLVADPNNNKEAFLFYQKDFGNSLVKITEVFPLQYDQPPKEWVIYDNAPAEREDKSIMKMEIPVSIKDPVKRYAQYSIGILSVEVFS